MSAVSIELKKQIEEAFQYRGHVTLVFKNGNQTEGYLFNREFENPRLAEDLFVEMFLKGSGDKFKCQIAELEAVRLTGEDLAAGKSYQDWMKKQEAKNH